MLTVPGDEVIVVTVPRDPAACRSAVRAKRTLSEVHNFCLKSYKKKHTI